VADVTPALSFLDHDQAVSRNVFHDFLSAAQPFHRHASCFAGAAEAEMQSQIALRAETTTAPHFLNLPPAFGFDKHS